MPAPDLHGRDHTPSWVTGGPGADPLDWLPQPVGGSGVDSAVYMAFVNKTIATAATTNLTGATAAQAVTKGDAMTVDNTTGNVTFVEDGIYVAWLNVLWSPGFTGLKMSRIKWSVNGNQNNTWDQGIIGEQSPEDGVVSTYSVRFVNITGGNNFLSADVHQASGVSQEVLTADLTVVQIAIMAFP